MIKVTQFGKKLSKSKYDWNPKTKVFSSNENNLVIDCSLKLVTFKTSHNCIFNTRYRCIFNTGSHCIFKTGSYCTFNTDFSCTFDIGSWCTFNTSSDCTFKADYNCTFKTGYNCVVVRRDVHEIIELEEGVEIKLNNLGLKGYKVLNKHKITIDGKEVEISEESYNNIKKLIGG